MNSARYLRQLDRLQKMIFLCLTQGDYLLRQDEYEKKLHQERKKLAILLLTVRQEDARLRQLAEILFSLNTLKFRIHDPATLEVCQQELRVISQRLSEALQAAIKRPNQLLDLSSVTQAIENFSLLYQTTLRIITADPAVFLFFIQGLMDFREQLQVLFPWRTNRSRAPNCPKLFLHKRHLISMAVAGIVALVIAHFTALTGLFLMPLVALWVMQTSIGSAFSEGVIRFFGAALFVSVMAIVLHSMPFFYNVMHDVFIGAAIGISVHLLVFPRLADVEFRAHMIAILQVYRDYFAMTMQRVLTENPSAQSDNRVLEKELAQLPSWVLNHGFDTTMRKGHRFFLLTIERMSDVLFSLHYLATISYEEALIRKVHEPLMRCQGTIQHFFTGLITVLELKKLSQPIDDFAADLREVEELFQSSVTLSLEMLDVKRDYICFAAFLADLTDLRELLLKLAQALR